MVSLMNLKMVAIFVFVAILSLGKLLTGLEDSLLSAGGNYTGTVQFLDDLRNSLRKTDIENATLHDGIELTGVNLPDTTRIIIFNVSLLTNWSIGSIRIEYTASNEDETATDNTYIEYYDLYTNNDKAQLSVGGNDIDVGFKNVIGVDHFYVEYVYPTTSATEIFTNKFFLEIDLPADDGESVIEIFIKGSIPTLAPTVIPTMEPTNNPSNTPTLPSSSPTIYPSNAPSVSPTFSPTNAPSTEPSQPTTTPTMAPTVPTIEPSISPTILGSDTNKHGHGDKDSKKNTFDIAWTSEATVFIIVVSILILICVCINCIYLYNILQKKWKWKLDNENMAINISVASSPVQKSMNKTNVNKNGYGYGYGYDNGMNKINQSNREIIDANEEVSKQVYQHEQEGISNVQVELVQTVAKGDSGVTNNNVTGSTRSTRSTRSKQTKRNGTTRTYGEKIKRSIDLDVVYRDELELDVNEASKQVSKLSKDVLVQHVPGIDVEHIGEQHVHDDIPTEEGKPDKNLYNLNQLNHQNVNNKDILPLTNH